MERTAMHKKNSPEHDSEQAAESTSASRAKTRERRAYQPPQITTRPLFERLALSCEHAVDPDTGELIVDGPS